MAKIKSIKRAVVTAIGSILCFFIVERIISHKAEGLIRKELEKELLLTYSDFRFSLWSRAIELKGVLLKKDTLSTLEGALFEIHTDLASVSGIDLMSLLLKKEVALEKLELQRPYLILEQGQKKAKAPQEGKSDKPGVLVKELSIIGGAGKGIHPETRETLWKVSDCSVNLQQLLFKGTLPIGFTFDTFSLQLEAKHIFQKVNEFDNLYIDRLNFQGKRLHLKNLKIRTKYDKKAFSTHLIHERDHFDLKVKQLELCNLQWGLKDEWKTGLLADSLRLKGLECSIFRDKTLPDDPTPKKFYAEMLGDLSFPLHIGWGSIAGSSLRYLEKTQNEIEPQPLLFNEIHGNFRHISNFGEYRTSVSLEAQLMGESPIFLDINTQIGNPNGGFTVVGKAFDFDATQINPFLRTNMGATSKGWVDELYFTFSGNRVKASGDMKMKYEDFEFQLLQKDLLGIKKTASFLLNLLVNSGSGTDKDGFRHGQIEAEPDTTKSFMNYIWVCVRSGLLDTVTGSGKKSER